MQSLKKIHAWAQMQVPLCQNLNRQQNTLHPLVRSLVRQFLGPRCEKTCLRGLRTIRALTSLRIRAV